MEERIISYEKLAHVEQIVLDLQKENFVLVQHSTKNKQLHFKKFSTPPQTLTISDP